MSVNNSAVQPLPTPDEDVLPAAPPPEVLAAVDAAGLRAAELAHKGRELHFAVDAAGALVIEVRDLRGTVIRTVKPSQALGIMSGFGGA